MSPSIPTIRAAVVVLALGALVQASPLIELQAIKAALNSRDAGIQTPFKGLPGCQTSRQGDPSNQDPTWAVGKSNYTEGSGIGIGVDCDGGRRRDHCWTDYFLVGTTVTYGDWYKPEGEIECDSGARDTCHQDVQHLSQSCTTFENSVSVGINAGFTSELFNFGLSYTQSSSESHQSCNTNVTSSGCTWGKGGCHAAWVAPKITTVHGYKRRSCESATDNAKANLPNQPRREDGFYTRGMMDFAVPLVTSNSLKCDATCTSGGARWPSPDGDRLTPWGKNTNVAPDGTQTQPQDGGK